MAKQKGLLKRGMMTAFSFLAVAQMMSISPDAYSQDRRGRGGRGDGDGRGRGQGRGNGNSNQNQDWINQFIGKPNFQLTDDNELRRLNQVANAAQNAVAPVNKQVKAKQDQIEGSKKSVAKFQKTINSLNAQIVQAVTEKGKLNQQKKNLQGQTATLQNNVTLAQAAADKTQSDVDKAKKQVSNVQQKLTEAKTACDATPTPACQKQVAQLTKRLQNVKAKLKSAQDLYKSAASALKQKQQALNNNKNKIVELSKKIAQLDAQNQQRTQQLSQNKAKLKQAQQSLKAQQNQLKPLLAKQKQLQTAANTANTNKNAYRNALISRILDVNRNGALQGAEDGRNDGLALADSMGTDHGSRDGDRQGFIDGEHEGRRRDYNIGLAEGDTIGRQRAQKEGEADGTREGTRQGNIDAAQREGIVAGEARAQASDAANVGIQQGNQAGMERAINTGRKNGAALGQQQAIDSNETQGMNQTQIDGPFAGAFNRAVPRFPLGYTGPSFTPRRNRFKREVVRKAFASGYRFRYHRRIEVAFYNNIDAIYNNVYDNSYARARSAALSQTYSGEINRGRIDGETRTFNALYPGIRDNFFNQLRAQFSRNPNRSSSEYQTTYKRVEGETYNRVYEEIRSSNFNRAELATFNANIKEQTEKYRALRYASVEEVYKQNAVLKYMSSSIVDAGISGVAAQDGVFQPREDLLHTVTIANFGEQAAKNVKIVLEDGSKSTIANVPAKSIVTIKGAAKSKVTSDTQGSTVNKVLRTYFPLTAEAAIQGRHYANTAQGLINQGDQKQLKVFYPLNLSGLQTKKTLIVNQPNGLTMNVSNRSKRNYQGELKIHLNVSSNGQVIKKGFNSLSKLASSAQVQDAEILVTDERDVYSPLRFSAHISKNGVVLGTLEASYVAMAKAPYKDRGQAPVVVTNSEEANRNDLLDVINNLGGIEQASVLDLSLPKLNASTINKGFASKTLLILDSNGRLASQFEATLKKSKDSTLVYIDDAQRGLTAAQKTSSFTDATEMILDIQSSFGVNKFVFTNNHRASGLADSLPAFQTNMRDFLKVLGLANALRSTAQADFEKFKASINASNYQSLDPTTAQRLQAFTMKSLSEILNINKAYEESGRGGLFGNRDKKWVKMIENDNSLLMHQLRIATKGRTNNENVGLFLAADMISYHVDRAINDYDQIEDQMIGKIESEVENEMVEEIEDNLKDRLKDYDRRLYDDSQDNHGNYAPFKIEDAGVNRGRDCPGFRPRC